jgi:AraC-like DNA-binding protein
MAVKGVLRTPDDGFGLRRLEPSDALAPYVAWLWVVTWDLPAPHEQITLPHPAANLVVEDGAATLWGPRHARWQRTLQGRGRAVAARFRPGGVRPLLGAPVASIADAQVPAGRLAGVDGAALVAAVDAEPSPERAARALERLLAPVMPPEPDPQVALADRAVRLVEGDRTLRRVDDLARALGLSRRSLQRLFADHVGLGPAHVIRRYRLQEVAAAATDGGEVDWARLALDLGYSDQAHLVRDFTAQVGTSPARYAAAGSPAARAGDP